MHGTPTGRPDYNKIYFGFVHLEKVFDRVPRKVIRWSICKLGVDEWLVSAVMSMYVGARAVVRTVHGNGDNFQVKRLACIKDWH